MSLQVLAVLNEVYQNENALSRSNKELLEKILNLGVNFSEIPSLIISIIRALKEQWSEIQNTNKADSLANNLQLRGFKGSRKERLHYLINGKKGFFNIGGEKGLKDLWRTEELKELEKQLIGAKPVKINKAIIRNDLRSAIKFYKEAIIKQASHKTIPEKTIEELSDLRNLTRDYLNKLFKIKLAWVLQQINKDLMPINKEKMIKALETIEEIANKQQKALFIMRNA